MTTKTKKGRFTPWCWEAERDEYDEESRRGWHLKNRTLKAMEFEYAPETRYRYAIDYRTQHDETRYLEFFEEDGWELVGTVVDGFKASEPGSRMFVSRQDGCWYIFRKEYDPGRPETEYEIATDEESIREFKNTLTKKYRNLLLYEAFGFLIYLACGLLLLHSVSYFVLLFGLCGILHAGYRLLCLNVLRPRKPLRPVLDIEDTAMIAAGAYVIFLFASAMFTAAGEDTTSPLITAENTPVQLFLDLRPDITVEEVLLLAEEYDLDANAYAGQRSVDTGERSIFQYYNYTQEPIYTIDLVPDVGTARLSSHFYENVGMAMVYDPDTMTLESAYLSINTEDGRAWCHYFPGEPTMEDCETGYNLFLQKSALAPKQYYHADTPAEIIAIAYPVLYPEGLA